MVALPLLSLPSWRKDRDSLVPGDRGCASPQEYPTGTLSNYSEDIFSSSVHVWVIQAFRQSIFPIYSDITSQIEVLLHHIGLNDILTPKPHEVRYYLLRHTDMVDLVRFACKTAWDQFAARAQLSLEVYRDPEIEDQYLTLYVRQEHYDEHILDEIEDVRRGYEDSLSDRSGWLLVTTDFQPPR